MPPPLFTEGESTSARSVEEEASESNSPQENAENEENESPLSLDPEEIMQMYQYGSNPYRGISIPAASDPTFLGASRADMRKEVFSNHLRQRSLQRSDPV